MWHQRFSIYAVCIALFTICASADEVSPWRWTCQDRLCVKTRNDPQNRDPVLSLEACKMFCTEYGLLWPKPTGKTDLGNFLSKININNIDVKLVNEGRSADLTEEAGNVNNIDVQQANEGRSADLMEEAGNRFKNMVSMAIPEGITPKSTGKAVSVQLFNDNPDVREFSLDMDESYTLRVQAASGDRINATIRAGTFFGLRHGLETLSQLIVYDDIRNHMLIVRDVSISDKPVYPYRGIHLDTSRNYYTIESIKATINAMAAVKMNTFHWHITDSHSFPFVVTRRPQLSKLGALSPAKVYTKEAIQEVIAYGLVRGVRVMPEFDAPAHVGEGWQDTGLTVCFKAEPWASFCVEPPCGQFNPTREELYDYLEDIYTEMADVFNPDLFHMGGDEVSDRCWNSSEEIQNFMIQNRWDLDHDGFLKLWKYFQTKAQDRAYKAFGKRLPIILWTSTLTEHKYVERFLDKEDYIIQIWTTGTDPQIKVLLEKGYRVIMSNYDALYLDCGFGAWVGEGNNWCSPYIGWQKVYDNSPAQIAKEHKHLVLGGEAALWSEQSDTSALDSRLWPRAAALAERLWAEPDHKWHDAEHRMLHIRERLVRMGNRADALQPEWCYQNEGYCYR